MVLALNNIKGGTGNRYVDGLIILLVLTVYTCACFFTTGYIEFALTSIEI